MKLIYCTKDFGSWCRTGKYHLLSDSHFKNLKSKAIFQFICDINNDDLAIMIADFRINGVPEPIAKYFIDKKEVSKC